MNERFICFIVSGYKTALFHAIARKLEEQEGIRSLWISPNAEWARWLQRQGVKADHVLDASAHWDRRTGSPEGQKILRALEPGLPYSVRNLINLDRNLRGRPYEYALNYLETILAALRNFATGKEITHVFSEQTWVFDIVVASYLESLGAEPLMPHTVRYPSNRFAFFKGAQQRHFLRFKKPDENDRAEAVRCLEEFRARDVKPFYFQKNNKAPSMKLSYAVSLIRHLRWSNDETKNTIRALASHRVMSFLRYKSLASLIKTSWVSEPLKDEPFVFMTLHKQPEASIDLLDYHNSNQFKLIRALADCLPLGTTLMVKEHSNALGDRGRGWYRQLDGIENVKVVSPFAGSRVFVEKAALTISVSGTACLEAALLGKRAVCLADTHFRDVLIAAGTTVKELDYLLRNIEDQTSVSDQRLVEFLGYVNANSFEGVICDSKTMPEVLDDKNIEMISHAFSVVLK